HPVDAPGIDDQRNQSVDGAKDEEQRLDEPYLLLHIRRQEVIADRGGESGIDAESDCGNPQAVSNVAGWRDGADKRHRDEEHEARNHLRGWYQTRPASPKLATSRERRRAGPAIARAFSTSPGSVASAPRGGAPSNCRNPDWVRDRWRGSAGQR